MLSSFKKIFFAIFFFKPSLFCCFQIFWVRARFRPGCGGLTLAGKKLRNGKHRYIKKLKLSKLSTHFKQKLQSCKIKLRVWSKKENVEKAGRIIKKKLSLIRCVLNLHELQVEKKSQKGIVDNLYLTVPKRWKSHIVILWITCSDRPCA